jgi:uncharacterized membrane protein
MTGFFAMSVAGITSVSLWLNSLTLVFLIAGLVFTLRRSTPLAGSAGDAFGYATFIRFGPLFFALPLAIFGMQHFALRGVVVGAVPPFMPRPMFWVWLVGAALIAAALSLITGRLAQLAALLTGIMLFLFVLMIHIPNLVGNPGDRFAFALFFRDLALSGGGFALAGTLAADTNTRTARWLRLAGRCFFGVAMIFFGIEHFPPPHFAPGVPLEMVLPDWIPAQTAWAWSTGAILIIGGVCILLNKRGSLAAVIVGMTYLVLVLFIYMPMEVVHPSIEISGELDYVGDTLIFSGAALFIAASLMVPTSRAELRPSHE